MKKFGIAALLLSVALLSGCNKANDPSEKVDVNEQVTITQEVTTAPEETPTPEVEEENLTITKMSSKELVSNMKIGWNLGNTLDASGGIGVFSESAWGNPVTKKEMIEDVINEGFNVIRIPVTWDGHVTTDGTYKIADNWLERVKEVVDYAYDQGVYVILNIHHENEWLYPSYDRQEESTKELKALWNQIALYFQEYDEHLIFEGMNEPRMVGTPNEWNGGNKEGWDVVNAYNQAFVETVRATGGNNKYRHLMVPSYAASSNTNTLKALVLPEDEYLIVSVHGYLPYNMALSDSNVTTFDPTNKEDTREIDTLVKDIDELFIQKGIPVIVGEMGTRNKENLQDRIECAKYYVGATKEIGVPCVWWDNNSFTGSGETLGLYDRRQKTWVYPEIVQAMMEVVK